MSARKDCEREVHRALGEMPERDVLAKMIASLATIEAFTTDSDTAGSARRTFEEISTNNASSNVLRGIVAGRESAGQMAARAAHTKR